MGKQRNNTRPQPERGDTAEMKISQKNRSLGNEYQPRYMDSRSCLSLQGTEHLKGLHQFQKSLITSKPKEVIGMCSDENWTGRDGKSRSEKDRWNENAKRIEKVKEEKSDLPKEFSESKWNVEKGTLESDEPGALMENVSDATLKQNRVYRFILTERAVQKPASGKAGFDRGRKDDAELNFSSLNIEVDNKDLEERLLREKDEEETHLKEVRCAMEHEDDGVDDIVLGELDTLEQLSIVLDSNKLSLDSMEYEYGVCHLEDDTKTFDSLNQVDEEDNAAEHSQEEISEKESAHLDEDKDEDTSLLVGARLDPIGEINFIREFSENPSRELTLCFDENLLLGKECRSFHEESFKDIGVAKAALFDRSDRSFFCLHREQQAMERCITKAYREEMCLLQTSLIQPTCNSANHRTSQVLFTSLTDTETLDMRDLVPSLMTSRALYIRPHLFYPLKKREKHYWTDEPLVSLSRSNRRKRFPRRHGQSNKLQRQPRESEKCAENLLNRRGYIGHAKPKEYERKRSQFGRGGHHGRSCCDRGANSAPTNPNEGGFGREGRGDRRQEDNDENKGNRQQRDESNNGRKDDNGQSGRNKDVDAALVPEDFKMFKKKHSNMLDIECAEFIGQLATLCNQEGGAVLGVPLERIKLCLENCLQTQTELPDDMLDCVLCTTLSSMLKHFANCCSAYNMCLMCVQIFSLTCSHACLCMLGELSGAGGRPAQGSWDPGVGETNCEIPLCQKVRSFVNNEEFSTRVRALWIWLRKNLARVVGEDLEVEAVEIEEQASRRAGPGTALPHRPSSIYTPTLTSIPETGGPSSHSSGGDSRNNSRKLARKKSNLTNVQERPASVTTEVQGETAPYSIPEPGSYTSDHETSSPEPSRVIRSLPEHTQYNKQGQIQMPSLSDQVTGEPGIGEVVYGRRQISIRVANYWHHLQTQYRREGSLPRQYREEGVILKEYSKQLVINHHRYQLDFQWVKNTHLGNGTSGKCHLATDYETDFKFCVKEIHIENYEKLEIELWSGLEHESIVKFYGAIRVNDKIYLLSEFVDGGCLTEAINAQRALNRRLSHVIALRYYRQLLQGLVYLEEKNILHEDIKADNILLCCGTLKIKIVDFGLAQRLNVGRVPVGTKPYGTQTQWSPEKARSAGYGHAAEVWAANSVLLHMLSGYPPWVCRFASYKILHVVIVDKSPPLEDIPSNIQEDVKDLLVQGFTVDPQRRPSARQLLQHRAFQITRNRPGEPGTNTSILYSVLQSTNKLESHKDLAEVTLESFKSPFIDPKSSVPAEKGIPAHILEFHGNRTQNDPVYPVFEPVPGRKQDHASEPEHQNTNNSQQSRVTGDARAGTPQTFEGLEQQGPSTVPDTNSLRPVSQTVQSSEEDLFVKYLTDNQLLFSPNPQNTSLEVYSPRNSGARRDTSLDLELEARMRQLPCFHKLMDDECKDSTSEEDDIFKDFDLEMAAETVLSESAEKVEVKVRSPTGPPGPSSSQIWDDSDVENINSNELFMSGENSRTPEKNAKIPGESLCVEASEEKITEVVATSRRLEVPRGSSAEMSIAGSVPPGDEMLLGGAQAQMSTETRISTNHKDSLQEPDPQDLRDATQHRGRTESDEYYRLPMPLQALEATKKSEKQRKNEVNSRRQIPQDTDDHECVLPNFDAISSVDITASPIPRSTLNPESAPVSRSSPQRNLHLNVRQNPYPTDIQTAPVTSTPAKPCWPQNNSNRLSQTLPTPRRQNDRMTLPASKNIRPLVHSSSTPRSMSELQDMMFNDIEVRSQHSESTLHLGNLFPEENAREVDEDEPLYNSDDFSGKSIAHYLDEAPESPGNVTVVCKATGAEFIMRMEGECCNKTWEDILITELSQIHDHFNFDRFSAYTADGTLLSLEAVVGRQNHTIYIQEADESEQWYMEAGMIRR